MESYILVNGNIAYANGSSWWLNLNERDLVKFGYTKLSSAKSALRRLRKDSGRGWWCGNLNPANWKMITVRETITREVF